eukprot:TRINITY_DN1957_c0_g2_i1.p1 TRINITY_DN1957_c0_g2~~TRINITY_DN1957_c0_g2_i1.p1  ORF type:complete len:187 (+),score=42.26 TRINITY_DN1957_c0_g2_i1:32-562(+)
MGPVCGANKENCQLLLLGLDNSGKTTIARYISQANSDEELPPPLPTKKVNWTIIDHGYISFNVFDVGGSKSMRSRWVHHFPVTESLVFVIDASDKDRIQEACAELANVLISSSLPLCPVVVLVHKQDIPGAMSAKELNSMLSLETLCVDRPNLMIETSVVNKQGLDQILDWITTNL